MIRIERGFRSADERRAWLASGKDPRSYPMRIYLADLLLWVGAVEPWPLGA